jgi:hypothetical protein
MLSKSWLSACSSVSIFSALLCGTNLAAQCGPVASALGNGLPIAAPFRTAVNSIVQMPNGDLIAGGLLPHNYGNLQRWNGTIWTDVGGGRPYSVRDARALPGGDLIVTTTGSTDRWNGTSWSTVGYPGHCLALRANGEVVYGDDQGVVRLLPGGGYWLLGGAVFSGPITALTVLANGDLIAGGTFTGFHGPAGWVATSNVARWNGSTWQVLGPGAPGLTGVQALTSLPNGDLVIGGWMFLLGGRNVPGVARWDGTAWQEMGSGLAGMVHRLTTLPNGDVMAGGAFGLGSGGPTFGLARWNGSAWLPMGSVGQGPSSSNEVAVYALGQLANGDLAIGGSFGTTNGLASPNVALLSSTCPALASPVGAGCQGTGGLNELLAESQPWIGTTFRSRASGLAAPTLAVTVLGFAPMAVPLAQLLPQGLPGCAALVQATAVQFAVPAGGALALQVALPYEPALVGVTFHQQVIAGELDMSGAITAATSTNALRVTLGSY